MKSIYFAAVLLASLSNAYSSDCPEVLEASLTFNLNKPAGELAQNGQYELLGSVELSSKDEKGCTYGFDYTLYINDKPIKEGGEMLRIVFDKNGDWAFAVTKVLGLNVRTHVEEMDDTILPFKGRVLENGKEVGKAEMTFQQD